MQEHSGFNIVDAAPVFLQAALLYTTVTGERRVRVHNMRLQATESSHEVFRHTDIDALLALYLRKSECWLGCAACLPSCCAFVWCARVYTLWRPHSMTRHTLSLTPPLSPTHPSTHPPSLPHPRR